ncbi:MAG: ABC transporter permease [Holophagales bacterium]|nr:ABC transporter permease [Holophagales bacterium]
MGGFMLGRALRSLWHERAFSVPAVLTIALGIGATTAVAGLAYSVLLRPFPYPEPQQLVRVFTVLTGEENVERNASLLDIRDYNERASSIKYFGAYTLYDSTLQGTDGSIAVSIAQLNQEALRAAGVQPAIGRLFEPDEDVRGGDVHKAILSHSLWMTLFGGRRDVLGETVTSPQTSFEIVGVMPPGFAFPNRAQLWLTMESWYALDVELYENRQRDQRWYATVARLEPGVTLERSQAEMDVISDALAEEYPETNQGVLVKLVPLRDAEVSASRPYVLILVAGVSILLAICLANVANLFVVQALARRRHFSIRVALGAGRIDMVRSALAESVVICVSGAVLGGLVAWGAIGAFERVLSDFLPAWIVLEPDLFVLGFSISMTFVVAVLLSAVPAWFGSRADPAEALKQAARGSSSTAYGRTLLILTQVALSFVLLVGAALLTATFVRLQQADHGFESENLIAVRYINSQFPEGSRSERAAVFAGHHERILERLERLPGVSDAAVSNSVPYAGGELRMGRLRVQGTSDEELRFLRPTAGADVGGRFFETMGIPLQSGRFFDATDTADSAPVVILGEVAAKVLFPDRDPIGQMVQWGDTVGPENPYCRVVGVVGDVKQAAVEEDAIELYYPFSQWPVANGYYLLRTRSDQASLAGQVREAIQEVDPGTAVVWTKAMNDRIDETLWQRRLWSGVFGAFAAVALLLASVGLYGLLSYTITTRRRELAVRLAIGARPARVGTMVVSDGMKVVAAGLVLGVLGAVGVVRLIVSLVDGVVAPGWEMYLAVGVVLLLAGLAACAWPALRASRINPVNVLRAS